MVAFVMILLHVARKFACVLASVALLGGCTDPLLPEAEAAQRWQQRKPASYSFSLGLTCFCGIAVDGFVRITVVNDSVISRTYVRTGAQVEAAPWMSSTLGTVDSLFAIVRDARERSAETIRAEYDAEFGFPAQVYIDYSAQIADEEQGWVIRDFVINR
jgi:hypothetical protein